MRLFARVLAEFIGTFAVVLIGAGAMCADAALRVTGSPGLGLLGIAIAQGLAYAVMISAAGPVSGGHLNPAISIGFWVTRRLGTFDLILYGAAQLLGGTAAARLLMWLMPESLWRSVSLGTPQLGYDFTRTPAMGMEAVLTFFLVFVFFLTTARAGMEFPKMGGLATGLTATACILFGGPFTGASMNPARALGPAWLSHHWANHGVYWIGPLLGGVVAAWICDRILLPQAD